MVEGLVDLVSGTSTSEYFSARSHEATESRGQWQRLALSDDVCHPPPATASPEIAIQGHGLSVAQLRRLDRKVQVRLASDCVLRFVKSVVAKMRKWRSRKREAAASVR
eukprot:scaffold774_cov248-Pinguiococcus_pyrenoidosus.AAC.5